MRKSYDKENGRSMIEMLGVLAIIGVLSVGGIAGYSKAMHRYRVNKTIDQITYMAGAIRSFFAPQKDYRGLDSGCTDEMRANGQCMALKAQLVPDEMWKSGEGLPQHMWGGGVTFSDAFRTQAEWNQGLSRAFSMNYTGIPEEACIDLITQDWSNAGINMIYIINEENAISGLAGKELFLPTPVDIETAIRVCSTAADDPDGVDEVKFFFDVDVNDSFTGPHGAKGWKDYIGETNTLLNGS